MDTSWPRTTDRRSYSDAGCQHSHFEKPILTISSTALVVKCSTQEQSSTLALAWLNLRAPCSKLHLIATPCGSAVLTLDEHGQAMCLNPGRSFGICLFRHVPVTTPDSNVLQGSWYGFRNNDQRRLRTYTLKRNCSKHMPEPPGIDPAVHLHHCLAAITIIAHVNP
jgi:hypothetical protein